MKKIGKILWSFLLVAAVSTGCAFGGGEPVTKAEDPTTVPAAPPEPVKLKVWVPIEDITSGWLEQMQESFQQQHPQYALTWINEGRDSEAESGLSAMQDPSGAADVFMFAEDQLPYLMERGCLQPLQGSSKAQLLQEQSSFAVSTVTHTDGEVYGFPMSGSIWVMYYDKTVFTQEDVASLDAMLEKGKVGVPLKDSWGAGSFLLGCDAVEQPPDEPGTRERLREKAGIAAEKMVQIAGHPNCVPTVLDGEKLIRGEVSAVFSLVRDEQRLREALGDRLGVAMLPTFKAGSDTYRMKLAVKTYSVGIDPKASGNDLELAVATEFAAFLGSREGQLERYLARGVCPAAQGLLEDERICDDEMAMAALQVINKCAVPDATEAWDSDIVEFGKACANGEVTLENCRTKVFDALGY